MSFAAITLFVASQRVFIVVSVYFVSDSVRKLWIHLRMSWYENIDVVSNFIKLVIKQECKYSEGVCTCDWNLNNFPLVKFKFANTLLNTCRL
jgi:hypothetical protein